jgi:hypothetical protein
VSRSRRARQQPRIACVALSLAALHGCIARGDTGGLTRQTDDDSGPPPPLQVDGGPRDASFELPTSDPHAVLGVDPVHGPWNGGGLAIVRGNGFQSNARVWFGTHELGAADIVPIDPGRIQVTVPAGSAGAVDVAVQNGTDVSTRRTLPRGFVYDAFYLEPASGPTSGGTRVSLRGDGTQWTAATEVFIDLKPCENKSFVSASEIVCTTPIGTPGAKTVRVRTEDGVDVDVLEAFGYGDSDNGYRGGLSGQPMSGNLKVIALDAISGNPLPAATVIAGDELASAVVLKTDSNGVAVASDPSLGPRRSVTIAKKCFHPTTFIDVPVDTVTAYLDPVLSPACGSAGDLPPVGGGSGASSSVRGEVVWRSAQEFQRSGWTNVPPPKSETERLVAYVFRLSADPSTEFQLPTVSNAVTPESAGARGYGFTFAASPGNLTLYALAGIENRAVTPPLFTAYAMGLIRGVSTQPNATTKNVYILVDVALEHAFTVSLTGPKPTPKGPDRVRTTVAIRVGDQGYALLPHAQKSALLPLTEPLSFVGLPPLVGSVAGSQYVTTARASTGTIDSTPRSTVGLLATTTSNQTLVLDRFVEIPVLEVPGPNGSWNGQDLRLSLAPGGASVELMVYEIQSSGNAVSWSIAAPAGRTSFRLPDLGTLDPVLALPRGPVTISVTAAHIIGFNYGSLRYRELDRRGWNAHATDVFFCYLP